jgi:hypothetical protein
MTHEGVRAEKIGRWQQRAELKLVIDMRTAKFLLREKRSSKMQLTVQSKS